MIDKCPCENCVCLAVCRLKVFPQLFLYCELIFRYEPNYNMKYKRDEEKIDAIYHILNPTLWSYGERSDGEPGVKLIKTKYMFTLLHNEGE